MLGLFQKARLEGLAAFAGWPLALAMTTVRANETLIPLGAAYRISYWGGAHQSLEVFDSDSIDYSMQVAQAWLEQDDRRSLYRAVVIEASLKKDDVWTDNLVLRARDRSRSLEFLLYQPYERRDDGEVVFRPKLADTPRENPALAGREREIVDLMTESVGMQSAAIDRKTRTDR